MKSLVAGFCFIVSCGAFAQFGGNNCTYTLLDEYNREIVSIDAYSCGDAQIKCERERDYQVFNNLIRQGTCVQEGGFNGGGYNGGGYNGGGYNGGGYNGGGYNGGGYNGGGYNGGNQYNTCEVSLQNSMGMTYQVFYGNNCSQALATCDQARIARQTPYEALFCRMTSGSGNGGNNGGGYNGGGYNQSIQCTFELKDVRDQRTVNQFMQSAVNEQQACELAYNQCQASARSYNGYSGIQNYVCSKRGINNGGGQNGGNNGQYTSASCSVSIMSTSNIVLERTIAQASGYGQFQAQQAACAQAQTQCRNIISSKVIPNRPSPYFGARCVQQ
ncbi:MAG: hypothetical protein ACOYL6_01375 [Bacteriovoracaceae bacterium]